jgi:hypothetical protein
MANVNESIEKLTASLQELTTQTYHHACISEPLTAYTVSTNELLICKEVETFVQETTAYANKTRNVSVGTY